MSAFSYLTDQSIQYPRGRSLRLGFIEWEPTEAHHFQHRPNHLSIYFGFFQAFENTVEQVVSQLRLKGLSQFGSAGLDLLIVAHGNALSVL